MTQHQKSWRRLQAEILESRLVLSAESASESLNAVDSFRSLYPGAVSVADPYVRAAVEAITTTASDEFVFRIDPGSASTVAGNQFGTSLAESTAVIGVNSFRDDARFAGVDGSGFSIVIIDTGADLDHPFFGPDADNNGIADRIVYNADFFGDRANAQDVNGHGTHVASIAASQDATHTGIAPGVNLIVLRVLNDAGVSTAASIEAALQWVAANVEEYNIASVNMSLSTFENFTTPDTRPDLGFADELEALAAQDVIVAAAAGNYYFEHLASPGVGYPAADPNVLAVSATWDGDAGGPISWASGATDFTTGTDRVVSFSQRHPVMTTIFAPGAPITAAAIGGGLQVISGTSMASPMVAGAAVLAQQLAVQLTGERLTVPQFKELLQSSAAQIFDGDDENDNVRNTNAWYGRIDVMALGEAILAAVESDLYFTDVLTIESADVASGGTARVAYGIGNDGLPPTGDFVGTFYLSSDPVIDATDTLLSSFTTDLAGLQSWSKSGIPVLLPAGATPGAYYLGLVLDSGEGVVESDELNNVSIASLTISDARAEAWLFDVTGGVSLQSGASTIDFGVIDQFTDDSTRTLRIYNDGSELLTVGPLSLPAGYVATGFPTEVAAGDSVQFTVHLESASAVGVYPGTASWATNDADENPFTLEFEGEVALPDDHGNNPADATIVTMPATVNGTIFQTGEVDWFRIRAVAGVEHTFSVILGTLSDSVLRLYDSDGVTMLTSDDDSGPGLASLIEWTAPHDGNFYLQVSRKGNAFGSYQLSAIPADDHGGAVGNATAVSDPSSTAGVIESPSDEDWFSFPVLQGVEYEIETVLHSLGGSTIRVMDADGVSQLAVSAPTTPHIGSLIHWTAPANGTYFIVVEGSASTQLGTYDLVLTGDDDHGDNAANATPIGIPDAKAGAIEAPLDVDWFSFTTIAGARYQFSTPNSTTDFALRIVAGNGATELAHVDGTGAAVTQLVWTAPASGTFYVEVGAAGTGIGTFELAAALVDDYGNTAATATDATDPSVFLGSIALAGDIDIFRLPVAAGVEYQFEASLGELPGLTLRVLGADGASVLRSAAASATSPAVIPWIAPADGVVYLEIAASSAGAVGNYQLSITGDDDHGDVAAQATLLAVPHPVDGEVESPTDADWFRVETLTGLDYRVSVGLGTLPEARIRLLAPDGTTVLAEATSDGEPLVELLWTASNALYFIEVTSLPPSLAISAPPGTTPGIGDYQVTASLLSPLPGDFDGNDVVDGQDLLVWQRLVGRTSNGAPSPLDAGGFEGYEFEEGEEPLLENADEGWVKLGPPRGSATIIELDAGNDVVEVKRGVNADSRWGVPLGPIAPLNNVMLIRWDMLVEQNEERRGALGPFFGVEAYDDAGTFGLLGSFGVDATSLDLIYQAQDTGHFTETGVKAAADVWHNFAISLDYARHEYTVYFDGQPLATTGFVDRGPLHTALDQLTDADISALASQDNAASRNATGTAYYDNFKIVNGVSGEFLRADGNRDGVVDGLDLQLWKDHFGLDYSGSDASAVAAASVVATPQAPASSLGMPMVQFESTWLEEPSFSESPQVGGDGTGLQFGHLLGWEAASTGHWPALLSGHHSKAAQIWLAGRDGALAQLAAYGPADANAVELPRWGVAETTLDGQSEDAGSDRIAAILDTLWSEL